MEDEEEYEMEWKKNKEELRNKKNVHGKGGKDQMEEDEGRAGRGRGEEKKKLGWKGEKDGMEWSLWKEVSSLERFTKQREMWKLTFCSYVVRVNKHYLSRKANRSRASGNPEPKRWMNEGEKEEENWTRKEEKSLWHLGTSLASTEFITHPVYTTPNLHGGASSRQVKSPTKTFKCPSPSVTQALDDNNKMATLHKGARSVSSDKS
ncbi:hypothetical protein M8J75_001499 [Diaphorina citri]|nr:hypothetical protein M8J75_001499 [Diaphorina citri]